MKSGAGIHPHRQVLDDWIRRRTDSYRNAGNLLNENYPDYLTISSRQNVMVEVNSLKLTY